MPKYTTVSTYIQLGGNSVEVKYYFEETMSLIMSEGSWDKTTMLLNKAKATKLRDGLNEILDEWVDDNEA